MLRGLHWVQGHGMALAHESDPSDRRRGMRSSGQWLTAGDAETAAVEALMKSARLGVRRAVPVPSVCAVPQPVPLSAPGVFSSALGPFGDLSGWVPDLYDVEWSAPIPRVYVSLYTAHALCCASLLSIARAGRPVIAVPSH